MTNEINGMQSQQPSSRVYGLSRKYHFENPVVAKAKQARLLALLKVRYGYTNEKAVNELERLLRQFYITNKSLGTHHARPDFRYPDAK